MRSTMYDKKSRCLVHTRCCLHSVFIFSQGNWLKLPAIWLEIEFTFDIPYHIIYDRVCFDVILPSTMAYCWGKLNPIERHQGKVQRSNMFFLGQRARFEVMKRACNRRVERFSLDRGCLEEKNEFRKPENQSNTIDGILELYYSEFKT